MKTSYKAGIVVVLFFTAISAFGQIRLPQLISDGMILQRDLPVRIWGWASPGENITLDFNGSTHHTSADSNGNWDVQLPPLNAGGPYTMTLKASNSIQINNILTGDVWICSGQSNMETPVSRVMTLVGDEIKSYANPNIRYVKFPLTYNFHGPQPDVASCVWTDLRPETALDFSAVAYFFAKEMYEKTGIPVGLINSSVGGSPVEAWISEEALKPNDDISQPVKVRYAWANNPAGANLYNQDGLPASPFQTK